MEAYAKLSKFKADVRAVTPIKAGQLALAHSKTYVMDILALREPNGHGTKDAALAASVRYTVAGMAAAAEEAYAARTITHTPVSGFHHAGWAHGGGFCTFNGLVVAAASVLQQHPDARVGILDMDGHYGDGTEDILRRNPDLRRRIVHRTVGAAPLTKGQDIEALRWTRDALEDMKYVDVILYQAGADLWKHDPLGAGVMSKWALRARDAMVFEAARARAQGVAWNLAGGYSPRFEDCLEIHAATMAEALRIGAAA
jgi:acetoin utilization deacetylase AcuC-like enzyme